MHNYLPESAVPFTNAYIVDVTPEIARQWLNYQGSARPVSASLVQKLAKDMSAGLWHHRHEGIAFDEDGTLIDGLHRLHAVACGEVTVSMLVIINEPRENVPVIDNRSPADN